MPVDVICFECCGRGYIEWQPEGTDGEFCLGCAGTGIRSLLCTCCNRKKRAVAIEWDARGHAYCKDCYAPIKDILVKRSRQCQ